MIKSALSVINTAFEAGAQVMAPLFSGGHDSMCATFIASHHPKFNGDVHHINTGIGAKATRDFVRAVCSDYGWNLTVWQSKETLEKFVKERGFPGPGRHQWVYNRLKDRCVRKITQRARLLFKARRVALITGCRSQESTRRMGSVESLKIGEIMTRKTPGGRETFIGNKNRYWTAPCHNWSDQDQIDFMNEHDLPRNPIKQTPLGMSGECFCGAFARPNEIALIRQYAPDVAEEIDRLTTIAIEHGKHSVWGTRPDRRKGVVVARSGPLCNSCDARAMAAGLIIDQQEMQCDLRD